MNTHAISLNGSQYVSDADNYWKPTTLTFETWFYPTANDSSIIFDAANDNLKWGHSGSGVYLSLQYESGAQSFETKTSDTTLTLNKWQHIAVSWKNSTKAYVFYLNGKADGSGTFTNAIDYDAGTTLGICWGGRADGVTPITGYLDDSRAWTDVRTAAEIYSNFRKELIGTEAGLKLYLKFNNNVTDSGPNTYNFAAQGSPTYVTTLPTWPRASFMFFGM